MKHIPLIKGLFVVAALYDGLLGLLFLLFPRMPFDWFDVMPPNHLGYVRFPAALLLIFGLMFAAIAFAPVRRRELIVYGILLKISYCGVVFYYWVLAGVPDMWKPFAIIDAIFLIAFLWAYAVLPGSRGTAERISGGPSAEV